MTRVVLRGVVGSTAYGLADEGSDVDMLGVFVAPTEQLLGLHQPKESIVTTAPDSTLHEARKFCRLALSGNPTALELLWLPDHLYDVRTNLGQDLIDIRDAFLSAHRVRDAYLGYAVQQFRKLEARGDGSFSSDTRKRTAKHARHLLRLLIQGWDLYRGQGLVVQLEDELVAEIREFGDEVAAGDIERARSVVSEYRSGWDKWPSSSLPDKPDETAVEAWLQRVRRLHLQ